MAEPSEHEKRIRDFRETAQNVLEWTEESLVRRGDLGSTGCFEELRPRFGRILGRFGRLKACLLDNVPYGVLQKLNALGNRALSVFERINLYSTEDPNARQVRRQLGSDVDGFDLESYELAAKVFATEESRDEELEQLRQGLREESNALSNVKQRAEDVLQETHDVLAQARAVVAEAGVSQHAMHFKEAANEYSKNGKRWLTATVISAVLAVGYTVFLFWLYMEYGNPDVKTGHSIQLAILKLLPLSILYSGLLWCAKNYRSQRHNYVISKHRHDALSTFEAFVKAAGDEQTKNAVLIQATQAVFSPQASGFVSQDLEGVQGPQVIELFRHATGAGKDSG